MQTQGRVAAVVAVAQMGETRMLISWQQNGQLLVGVLRIVLMSVVMRRGILNQMKAMVQIQTVVMQHLKKHLMQHQIQPDCVLSYTFFICH